MTEAEVVEELRWTIHLDVGILAQGSSVLGACIGPQVCRFSGIWGTEVTSAASAASWLLLLLLQGILSYCLFIF